MSANELAKQIGALLLDKKLTLATAESCTGGGVSACITSIAGSSAYFKGGIVAYSNEIKIKLLHVSPQTLEKYGAVSRETVVEMAKGVMDAMDVDCAIATSGIAGPGGGSDAKPVGTIWMAVANKENVVTWKQEGDSGRSKNMENAVENALFMLYNMLE